MTKRRDELRAEAKALRKNLTAKISRMAKTQNVNISGTGLDPRKPSTSIDSMSAPSLNAYIRNARTFLSRDVGYVRGHRGTPIPRSEWNAYKRDERANNRVANQRLEKYGDIKIPGTTMTPRERQGMRNNNPRMRNTASNRPIDFVNRENAEGITSVKALRRIRKQMQTRQNKGHIEKSLKKTKQTAIKAVTKMGDERMIKWVKGMSLDMLDFLWNYGGLAESIFSRYENIVNSAMALVDARGFDKVSEDAESDLNDTIEWAATFDRFKKS